jgi:signal transduction histidine kinase
MSLCPQKNAEGLLKDWHGDRALRVVKKMSGLGLTLAIVTTIVDFSFGVPVLVKYGDIFLILGIGTSFFLSIKSPDILKPWIWVPLYFGIWIGEMTSLWTTGGINSPFIGGYIALLFVGGFIIQTQVKTKWIVVFSLANLVFWLVTEVLNPGGADSQPPLYFNVLINSIVIIALMVYVQEFLKTETGLAKEIVVRYQELEKAHENVLREEAANAAKSAFLANISHELRTPLGAILGYAELLQDHDTAPENHRDYADTILRNGRQLSKLVNDLLDLSKVEAGKIELETLPFRPERLFKDVIELLKIPAQKKSLSLKLSFRDAIPKDLISDPMRIKQILLNIIGNAIKFTDKGEVSIRVYFQSEKSLLRVEVQDSGKGLSFDEQSRLFKPFSQADASITRKFGGTGLGLSLSRHLARLLGGDLQLEWSQPGVGSQFVILLPVKLGASVSFESYLANEKSAEQSVEKDQIPQILCGTKILLVDDMPDNQTLVSLFLQKTGAEVDVASDGVQAIQKVAVNLYDLILMDIQMPVMDGLQAVAVLRQKKFLKPIIALTAHAMKEDRDRCLAAGFDDYIVKPVDRQLLVAKVISLLSRPLRGLDNSAL